MHTATTGARPAKSAIFTAIQALSLILAIYALWGAGTTALYYLQGAPGLATLKADIATRGSTQRVESLGPGSPLAASGVRRGDTIRLDRPVDIAGFWQTGESVGLTRLTAAGPVHVQIAPAPVVTDAASAVVMRQVYAYPWELDSCTTCFSVLIGVLLVIRARHSKALLALGFAFVVFDCYTPQTLWIDPQWRRVAGISGQAVQGFAADAGFLLFAAFFFRENIGRVKRWVWFGLGVYLAVLAALLVAFGISMAKDIYIDFGVDIRTAYGAWSSAAYAFALVGLLVGWRRSHKELQKRYALLCLATALVIVADIIFNTGNIWISIVDQGRLSVDVAQLMSVAGHALFAYAVLRHRVIDLSFATNRVLVYGGVSTLLLVAFGLLEWAFEHFIPIEGREKNAFIDAGLALVVFLTFHRVRDFVEHHIEALFFHAWQRNEAKLRTFVAEAAFVTKPEALTRALVDELKRFTGGAAVAFYWQTPGGDYGLLDGEGSTRMDGDDATLVTLRATGKSVEISEARKGWSIGLAIPVIMRADLMGFIALGSKPSGAGYRPDEIEVLGWAVQQIGLDLHTRRVQQLEQANQVLEIKYNELKSVVAPKRATRTRQLGTT